MTTTLSGRRVTPTARLITPADADHDVWLTARRGGIGSSDIAAVLGLSKYGNALSVYHDKRGSLPLEGDDSEPALWGRAIEDTVAREWCRRNRSFGRRVGLVAHTERPWQRCTLDRRIVECPLSAEREACALEIKCRSAFKAGQWRAGIPDDVLAQVLWQADVTGFDHVHAACLIGGNDYRQFVIRVADYEATIDDLRAAGAHLWEQIQAGRPPVLDRDADPDPLIDLYRRLHPDRQGLVRIDRDGDAQNALGDYCEAAADESAAKKAKKQAHARLLGHLGGAYMAVLGDKPAYSIEQSSKSTPDLARLREEFPEAYAACVVEKTHDRLSIPDAVRKEYAR
ncbi:hypothetical protein B4N89_20805 [Embleya scabrispora]|uniref:YqaJ viral recombinase domain-containing protein n=1 Tax=Embleya scabrispora TaxID=159449 RepID=A0A1T3P1T0_9ACTN|nr:YqaJ viral recombinase family protein [Embleya scabrispora]OPC83053.1 hypothetical protein B4N89_20805 [Embleya scabrispora]